MVQTNGEDSCDFNAFNDRCFVFMNLCGEKRGKRCK